MTAYTDHGETSSAKRNSGRNQKLSERDCRTQKTIVSKNQRTVAAKLTAELNTHHEDPVLIKQSDEIFTNQIYTGELQLLNI
jgi:hypothetical protein